MVQGRPRTQDELALRIPVWREPAVRTGIRVLPEDNLFDAPDPKLCHQRKVPTESLAKSVSNCLAGLATFLPVVHGEHPANLDKVCEGRCNTTGQILLAVNERDHPIQLVKAEVLHRGARRVK